MNRPEMVGDQNYEVQHQQTRTNRARNESGRLVESVQARNRNTGSELKIDRKRLMHRLTFQDKYLYTTYVRSARTIIKFFEIC